jgi:hypothetical protein
MPALLDIKGEKYNRLTVLHRAPRTECNKTRWRCRCDCGNVIDVFTMHLRGNHTKSCGKCIPRQNSDRVLNEKGELVRPDGYHSWKAIQSRCYCKSDSRYAEYGGRGIEVCPQWLGKGGLAQFLKDMGKRPSKKHSVGRKTSDCNYAPENCKWETPLEQGRNKRNANMLTLGDRTMHIAAWDRELGLHTGGVRLRLSRDWSVHKALSTPRLGRAPVGSGVNPKPTGCANQEVDQVNPRWWLAD